MLADIVFAHKGGLHVSGIQRNTRTYEHVDPALLGNNLARAAVGARRPREHHLQGQGVRPRARSKATTRLGICSRGAQTSREPGLRLRRRRCVVRAADAAHARTRQGEHFNFVSFRVFDDKWHEDQAPFSEAVIIIEGPDGARTRNSAIGNGPVNALDSALRQALVPYYPNPRGDAARRLQGPRARQRRRDRGARARAYRIDGRQAALGARSAFRATWSRRAGRRWLTRLNTSCTRDNVKPRIKTAKHNGARPRSKAAHQNHAVHSKA